MLRMVPLPVPGRIGNDRSPPRSRRGLRPPARRITPHLMSDAKIFISANDLLADSWRLGMQVLDSGLQPTHLVGICRGGAPVGIAVGPEERRAGKGCVST